jgi:sodium-dependent dicarboxylate transporter 2/3/5
MLAGFIVAAAFLSMWISNTSTSLILTPLALSVAAGAAVNGKENPRFATALVLAIAYAATIGGLATPIGTPTATCIAPSTSCATGVRAAPPCVAASRSR